MFFGDGKVSDHLIKGLEVLSIRLIKQCQNLQSVIKAISYLDNWTSLQIVHVSDEKQQQYALALKEIFNYLTKSTAKPKFIPYIYDTFSCFANNKKSLGMDLASIHWYIRNQNMLDILVRKNIKKGKENYPEINLNPDLLKIFKNVTSIQLNAEYYPISFLSLLSSIKGSGVVAIKIAFSSGFPWQRQLVIDDVKWQQITREYDNANFKITFVLATPVYPGGEDLADKVAKKHPIASGLEDLDLVFIKSKDKLVEYWEEDPFESDTYKF